MPVRTKKGPQADQPHSNKKDRIDEKFKKQGNEIKKLIEEVGYGTQQSFIDDLPTNLPYVKSIDSFRKFLAGRKINSDREEIIEAMIVLFAEKFVKMYQYSERDGLEKTKSKIRARIYKDNSSLEQLTPTDVAPSFTKLEITSATDYADDFLDVKTPIIGDIVAGFDIKRSIYTDDDGLKTFALTALAGEKGIHLATISGASGAGKSILALQLAHDCLASGYSVYKLYNDWGQEKSLSSQIRAAVEQVKCACVFIFDGAANLARAGIDLSKVYRDLGDIVYPVLLVGVEARQLSKISEVEGLRIGSETRHFPVHCLSNLELEKFVDHVIKLETSGKVQDVRCSLSKAERIALCSEERDRYPATALLIFRYGRSVADILIEEYDSLKDSFAQVIYSYIITFSGLGLGLPRSCINRILQEERVRETGFWAHLECVTSEVEGIIGIRHNIFFHYIAPHAISNVSDRARIIIDALLAMSEKNGIEDNFVNELFLKHREISSLLNRDNNAIKDFISQGRDVSHEKVEPSWRTGWLTYLGRISSFGLFDYATADECFAKAIKAYPENKFAFRERAWNLLRAGESDRAEEAARNAIKKFPLDVTTLVKSATILQYTSESGFDLAGEIFERVLELDPDNDEAKNKQEKYEDAAAYRRYISSSWEGIEGDILERLDTPWFVWTYRKGPRSSQAIKAVREYLRGLGQTSDDVDIDQIREIEGEAKASKDKITTALYNAALARAEYQQWYHRCFDIDVEETGQKFEDAISDEPKNPLFRSWYGTFLKDVKRDLPAAEDCYRAAIDLASRDKRRDGKKPLENYPIFLNNLALLLIEKARIKADPKANFMEAQTLLEAAIKKNDADKSNYPWLKKNYDDLIRLKKEAGIE